MRKIENSNAADTTASNASSVMVAIFPAERIVTSRTASPDAATAKAMASAF